MPKPGRDVNGIARTEADHHMQRPACGQWSDMRDLAQVMEIEVLLSIPMIWLEKVVLGWQRPRS
jgi:hypothetical protein